jgi:serine/threonine-protein kinase ULK/ATG1
MSTPLSSSTAHVVGPYEIGREIGKGSFAVVHRGVSHVTQPGSPGYGVKHVAIKIVNRKKLTTKLLENLEGEISIMRTIRHRHVVELLDCLSTDDRIYLVMPFCASGDLSHYIRAAPRLAAEAAAGRAGSTADMAAKSGELVGASAFPHFEDGGINETVVRSFLQQLASAMEFMRDRNIVHRDIKPQVSSAVAAASAHS